MRISGGKARGIPLTVPRGEQVRPATDGLRQAVFSALGPRVVGATFLDLFAGSGAYGLEALSRGAEAGGFVERNAAALAALRGNLAAVAKSAGVAEAGFWVEAGDAAGVPWRGVATGPDLVFIDPPYDLIAEVGSRVLAAVAGMASEDVVVVFEMPGELTIVAEGWREVKRLGRGARQPTVVLFRRVGVGG